VMAKFSVSYEIVTEESAEAGDADERGFISEDSSLRHALTDLFGTRTQQVEGITGIETDSWAGRRPRWVSVYNGMEFLTGDFETRSFHIPDTVTNASACRIARLIFKTGGYPCPHFKV
jgi:hypothetical protein